MSYLCDDQRFSITKRGGKKERNAIDMGKSSLYDYNSTILLLNLFQIYTFQALKHHYFYEFKYLFTKLLISNDPYTINFSMGKRGGLTSTNLNVLVYININYIISDMYAYDKRKRTINQFVNEIIEWHKYVFPNESSGKNI